MPLLLDHWCLLLDFVVWLYLMFCCIFEGFLLWIFDVYLLNQANVFKVIWKNRMRRFIIYSLESYFILRDLRLIYNIAILLCIFILVYRLFLWLIIDPILFVHFSSKDLIFYCYFRLFASSVNFRVYCVFIKGIHSYLLV